MQSRAKSGVGLIVILIFIMGNYFVFKKYFELNYFEWYLGNAALIGVAASFLGIIWEGIGARRDLISADPAQYLSGCFVLLASLLFAILVHIKSEKSIIFKKNLFYEFINAVLELIIAITIIVILMMWLLVVAPLNYFFSLVCGSVARREFNNLLAKAVYKEGARGDDKFSEIRHMEKVPEGCVDISIGKKPFVFTQALSAMFIWLMGLVYNYYQIKLP